MVTTTIVLPSMALIEFCHILGNVKLPQINPINFLSLNNCCVYARYIVNHVRYVRCCINVECYVSHIL